MEAKYLSLLLIVLLCYKPCAAQEKITPAAQQQYLFHINKAALLSADSLYKQACEEYEMAFSIRKDFVMYLFECAKAYDMLNNAEQTLKYLKMSIAAGCDWYDDAGLLPNLKKTNKYLPLSQYEPYRQEYYQNINMDYFMKLEKMMARDQAIRNISSVDLAKITDPEAEGKLIGIVDSSNMEELKGLIEKYGYPDYSKVGYQGETDMFAIVLHGLFDGVRDSLDWTYYQPIMLKAVTGGSIMPMHYAWLYDRVVSKNGTQKQCYGVQFGIQSNGSYSLQGDIYDIMNVDLRRKEIGLPALEDQFKMMKMKLPEGYVRK
jgi:hypothetical protein